MTVHIAVIGVQPLMRRSSLRADRLEISTKVPPDIYAIIAMGITISFAGNPKMNAIIITPSRPIREPIGLRNAEQYPNNEVPFTEMFAISQIISPDGAATIAALPRTNRVLSRMERIRTFIISGFR